MNTSDDLKGLLIWVLLVIVMVVGCICFQRRGIPAEQDNSEPQGARTAREGVDKKEWSKEQIQKEIGQLLCGYTKQLNAGDIILSSHNKPRTRGSTVSTNDAQRIKRRSTCPGAGLGVDLGNKESAEDAEKNVSFRALSKMSFLKRLSTISIHSDRKSTVVIVPKPGTFVDADHDLSSGGGGIEEEGAHGGSTTTTACHAVASECSICLMEYNVGDRVTWSSNFKCRHVFHEECVVGWFTSSWGSSSTIEKKARCPICRHAFVDVSRAGSLSEAPQPALDQVTSDDHVAGSEALAS